MYWRSLYLIFFFILSTGHLLQSQPLSDQAKINLLTCGPGNDLYSTFGHSAFYVRDPVSGIDKVYNYGTFDFDTPNFYLKFCQGELDYFLNVTSFDRFAYAYSREGRWVHFQELNLDSAQTKAVYAFLENNAKIDNKFYRYRFLSDNCSTRPRDVLETVLGDNLVYQKSERDSISYRHFIDRYLGNHPWSDLGIDIALGYPCDGIPDQRERMFLPDFVYDEFQNAQLLRQGESEPLVRMSGVVLEENRKAEKDSNIAWIFWTLFVIALISALFFNPRRFAWFDISLFTLAGLIGIFILLLWFATSHAETKSNFNILWASPTWLYGAYLLVRKRPSSLFFKIHAIAMFAIVVFWSFIPQNFHSVVIPVILILAVRSWAWQKQRHLIRKKAAA